MKINKIQCDICGNKIEYDENVNEFKKKLYLAKKDNYIDLTGFTKIKTETGLIKPACIHIKYDLCDKCLNDLHKYLISLTN